MSKRHLLGLSCLFAAFAGEAGASGFVNNGAAFEVMTPAAQAAYVEGLNDSANLIFVNDDLPTAIVKYARTRCLIEHKTTSVILAQEINNVYVVNKAMEKQPPIAVYIYVMTATCKDFINQERARLGLPPV